MWYCAIGKHYPAEVVICIPEEEEGIMINGKTGEATGRYADGTVGVPDEIQELAEENENPYCIKHGCYCDWVDKEVT